MKTRAVKRSAHDQQPAGVASVKSDSRARRKALLQHDSLTASRETQREIEFSRARYAELGEKRFRAALVEEALRENREFLEIALQSAHAGTWELNFVTRQTRWSDEVYDLLGTPRGTPSSYEAWLQSVHPDDRAAADHAVKQVVRQQHSDFRFDFRIVHPKKGVRWLAAIGRADYENGRPLRMAGLNIDITERKQQEREREQLLGQFEKERARLAVQYAVVRALSDSSTIEEAAPKILSAFCENINWQVGGFWLLDAEAHVLRPLCIWQQPGTNLSVFVEKSRACVLRKAVSLPGRVWADRQPIWVPDFSRMRWPRSKAAQASGLQAACAFPILVENELLGVIEFFNERMFEPQRNLLKIIAAMGSQIGQFMLRIRAEAALRASEDALRHANNQLETRVRERTAALSKANNELCAEINQRNQLERELLTVTERAQRRLGQDLHDGVCQELAAIAFMSCAVATRLTRKCVGEAADVDRIARLVNEAVKHTRNIARGLHPLELDSGGLMQALRDLANSVNESLQCTFECKKPVAVPQADVALNLYRIAQEAVTNALRHAQATRILISLERRGDNIALTVRDDGIGLRGKSRRAGKHGMGVHILHYRARTIGASLSIANVKPKGTQVRCSLASHESSTQNP
jgi:PAS domain S-box-containing protein